MNGARTKTGICQQFIRHEVRCLSCI